MATRNSVSSLNEKYFTKSTVMQEVILQKKRLMRILDEVIDKMDALAYLPFMLDNDCEFLRKYLLPSDFRKYFTNTTTEKDVRRNSSSQMVMLKSNRKERDCLEYLYDIFEFIYSRKDILEYVLRENGLRLEFSVMRLKRSLVQLKNIARTKMSFLGSLQVEKANEMRDAYRAKLASEEVIKRLKTILEEHRNNFYTEFDNKQVTIRNLTDKLEIMKINFNKEIMEIVENSEQKMTNVATTSKEIQAQLEAQGKSELGEYNTLLEEHLEKEKHLRAARSKWEVQITSMLAKYDKDVGAKQAELDHLKEELEHETELLDDIEENLLVQSTNYNILMAEKKEEEDRIIDERALIFVRNKSARIIQRAWRAYRLRKLARKKGKKSKSKGKEKSAK